MISKENIEEVLEYNGVKFTKHQLFRGDKRVDVLNLYIGEINGISITFDNPNLIPLIFAHCNKKLKPLPIITEYELKIGDSVEVDNFGNTLNLVKFDYVDEEVVYRFGGSTIGQAFKYINKTKSVNGKKYDKLTIPAFDFKQTLLDNGFTRTNTSDCFDLVSNGVKCRFEVNEWFYNGHNLLKPTPENANILIDMAKLAKGLK